MLCSLGTRKSDAKFKVTQNWVNGNNSITFTCENHMDKMGEILTPNDVIESL
jgi:hypothetical protein